MRTFPGVQVVYLKRRKFTRQTISSEGWGKSAEPIAPPPVSEPAPEPEPVSHHHHQLVHQFGDHGRIVADGVQWVLQSRRGDKWIGVSWCQTKEALFRCAGVKAGDIPELDALPDRFPDASRMPSERLPRR